MEHCVFTIIDSILEMVMLNVMVFYKGKTKNSNKNHQRSDITEKNVTEVKSYNA